jgi:hypothetical protein
MRVELTKQQMERALANSEEYVCFSLCTHNKCRQCRVNNELAKRLRRRLREYEIRHKEYIMRRKQNGSI